MSMNHERKKNVLIVHNYYQIPGGEDTVVENERKLLENNGHKVILYTRNNNELKTMSKIKKLLLPITTIFNFRTYFEVKKIIKNEKIEIVHVHNTLNLISAAVYYAALSCKIPVVQTIHNFRLLCPAATFYREGKICEDCVNKSLKCAIKHGCYRRSKIQTIGYVFSLVFHRMTGIYGRINYICLTDFNKKKMLELKQIKPEKVFVKPNFVENKKGYISEKDRKNQFVFAGRLDELKGIDLLFAAWKVMGEEAPKLIVCGIGPMEDWCRRFIRENIVNIEMRGFVSNDDTLRIIANSRALVLPTRWYEGFPMSIVEAFSVGTPVICSDIGNAGSIVKEGETGYKFSPNTVYGIINAVEKCHGLCSQTKKIYQGNYSVEKNYESIMNIYKII